VGERTSVRDREGEKANYISLQGHGAQTNFVGAMGYRLFMGDHVHSTSPTARNVANEQYSTQVFVQVP